MLKHQFFENLPKIFLKRRLRRRNLGALSPKFCPLTSKYWGGGGKKCPAANIGGEAPLPPLIGRPCSGAERKFFAKYTLKRPKIIIFGPFDKWPTSDFHESRGFNFCGKNVAKTQFLPKFKLKLQCLQGCISKNEQYFDIFRVLVNQKWPEVSKNDHITHLGDIDFDLCPAAKALCRGLVEDKQCPLAVTWIDIRKIKMSRFKNAPK